MVNSSSSGTTTSTHDRQQQQQQQVRGRHRHDRHQKQPQDAARQRRRSSSIVDSTNAAAPPATDFQRALPQFLAVGVKNVLLFGYGMTLGFPTIVIPAIQGGDGRDPHQDIVLNREEISWFSSINLLCVPLGCIFSGMFTQPIGKRRAMQIVNLPIIGAWLLFYFSSNIYHLYAGLCLAGLSGGLMEAPVLTYVAEITEPRFRGMLSATGSTCVICGVFTQFLLGSLLKWRTIAAISTVFPVLSITALFFVPESPHWLILKGRFAEAQRALAWLRGWVPTSHVQREYDEIYEQLVLAPAAARLKSADGGGDAEDEAGGAAGSSYVRTTLRRYARTSFLLPYALIALCFFVGHFSGKTTLQTYAVQIFHTLKAPIDKYWATVLLGGVEIVGTLVCVALVHYTGKRPLVLVSTLGCGLCFLGTATYARFLDEVPGVVVENVVANVSAVDFVRDAQLVGVVGLNRSSEALRWMNDGGDEDERRRFEAELVMRNSSWHDDDADDSVGGGGGSAVNTEASSSAGLYDDDTTITTATTDDGPPITTTSSLFEGSGGGLELEATTTLSLLLVLNEDSVASAQVGQNVLATNDDDIIEQHSQRHDVVGGVKPIIPSDILLRIPNAAENTYSWVPLTLLLMSAFFAHMGIKLIPWMLIGEVFPASVRSGASGISSGTGYLFGFLANKLFLSMLNTLSMPGTFGLYAAVAIVGSAVLYFVLPETEGRTLMDIERHFAAARGEKRAPLSSLSLALPQPVLMMDVVREFPASSLQRTTTTTMTIGLNGEKPLGRRKSYEDTGAVEPRSQMTHL